MPKERSDSSERTLNRNTPTILNFLNQIEQNDPHTVTILPEFRTWALENLGKDHDNEVTKRTKVYESQLAAIAENQSQIDNLTRMRARDLIDDAEYIRERDRLKAEQAELRKEIDKTETRADRWLELTEELFDFATYAHSAFLKGDLQRKKEIMMALGSNPTILHGKLRIEAHPWLVPIVNEYPALEAEYRRLEPMKNGEDKHKTDAFSHVSSMWLRIVDGFRTVNWQTLDLTLFSETLIDSLKGHY